MAPKKSATAQRDGTPEESAAACTLQRFFKRKQIRALPWPALQELKTLYMDDEAIKAGAEEGKYYTDEMILRREALRSDSQMNEALADAWDRLKEARTMGGGVSSSGGVGNSISREAFMTMSRKLYLHFTALRFDGYIDAQD